MNFHSNFAVKFSESFLFSAKAAGSSSGLQMKRLKISLNHVRRLNIQ